MAESKTASKATASNKTTSPPPQTSHGKLVAIQNKMKVPKSHRNEHHKYNYRNSEDILDVVKPLLLEHDLGMVITDDIVHIKGRFYVKANVKLYDLADTGEREQPFEVATAYAREAAEVKGRDASQLTGAASSYARKYALSGLFAIDDGKDADSTELSKLNSQSNGSTSKPAATNNTNPKTITAAQIKKIKTMLGEMGAETNDDKKQLLAEITGTESIKGIGMRDASKIIEQLTAVKDDYDPDADIDLNEQPF